MKKQSRKQKIVLAAIMMVIIICSNSIGSFAAVCPSPYSPTGYHDFSRHTLTGGEYTISKVHDAYVGTFNGSAYYETCSYIETYQWCITTCCFCGKNGPSHSHKLRESHSLNHG